MFCLLHYEPTLSSATSSITQQNHHHHHCIALFFLTLILKTYSSQTLAEAIEVAGLGEALSGGSFTIFAPTDNAFLEFFDATKQTKEQFLVTITHNFSHQIEHSF